MGKNDMCVHCSREVPQEQRVAGAPHVLCQRCYDQTEGLKRYWTDDWPAGDPRDRGKYV